MAAEMRKPAPPQDRPSNNTYDAHNTAEVRRAGALRLPPLECGHRDPWSADHRREYPSDRMIDGYRDALAHLDYHGLIGAPILPELRLLWQRGGSDRRVAQAVAQCWELAS